MSDNETLLLQLTQYMITPAIITTESITPITLFTFSATLSDKNFDSSISSIPAPSKYPIGKALNRHIIRFTALNTATVSLPGIVI